MGLGVARGGAVRIGGVGHTIGIAEGIETALAVRQLVNEQTGITFPVWAALSANGMQSVEISSKVFQVKIFPDHDQPTRLLFVGKPSVGMIAAKGLALAAKLKCGDFRKNANGTWTSGPNTKIGANAFPKHTFDIRGVRIGGADLATVLNRKCGG
jgi:Toprim domain